jgi:hypothetical protein
MEHNNIIVKRIKYYKNIYNVKVIYLTKIYLTLLTTSLIIILGCIYLRTVDVIILGSTKKEKKWYEYLINNKYKCLLISNNKTDKLYYPTIGYFKYNSQWEWHLPNWEWHLPNGIITSKYLLLDKDYPLQYKLQLDDIELKNNIQKFISNNLSLYLNYYLKN